MTTEATSILKRVARLFWSQGYFVRTEVPLSSYFVETSSISREDITDIDVFALQWDDDFSPKTLVCECKTGSNVKPIDRTLWVRGVRSYFAAQKAYLVCEKGNSVANDVGARLGVNVFDNDMLNRSEQSLGIASDDWFGSLSDEYQRQREKVFSSRALRIRNVVKYLRWGYWVESPYSQVKRLIWIGAQTAEANVDSVTKTWLRLELSVLFTSSLLSFCGTLFNRRPVDLPRETSAQLFGGHINLRERQSIANSLHRFLKNYIKTTYGDEFSIGQLRSLEPEYYENLLELVDRILQTTQYREVPRFLDFISYEWLIKGKDILLDELEQRFPNCSIPLIAKLSKNILMFYLKYSKLDEDLYSSLFAL